MEGGNFFSPSCCSAHLKDGTYSPQLYRARSWRTPLALLVLASSSRLGCCLVCLACLVNNSASEPQKECTREKIFRPRAGLNTHCPHAFLPSPSPCSHHMSLANFEAWVIFQGSGFHSRPLGDAVAVAFHPSLPSPSAFSTGARPDSCITKQSLALIPCFG